MKTASVSSVKNRLSSFLDLVRQGEDVIITDRGRPIARLSPLLPSLSTDSEAWRQELESRGTIKRAVKTAEPTLLDELPAAPDTSGDAVAAIIEERKAGR